MAFTPGWNVRPTLREGSLQFSADFDPMGDLIGRIDGISAVMESPNSIATISKYTWAICARRFNEYMNALAISGKQGEYGKYNHVYEWGMQGVPAGQLWRQRLSGGTTQRMATYYFISSVRAIPKPDMSNWTPDAIAEYEKYKMGESRYVFHDKAIVMETGAPVFITGRHNNKIFIPLPNGSNTGADPDGKGYVWANSAINTEPGGNVAGNFTSAWEAFWNTEAQSIYNDEVAPELAKQITEIVLPSGKVFTPSLVKSGGLRGFELAVDGGATLAAAKMKVWITNRRAKSLAYEETLGD